MQRKASLAADLGLGAFLILVCTATLWESRDIPPGTFEPLGSAPVPQVVAGLIICLCLVVMMRAWRESSKAGRDQTLPSDAPPRWADATIVATQGVLYCLALHLRLGRFDVLTSVFLFLAIGVLVRFKPASLLKVVVISLTVGFGCQFIFTKIFIVDLPGAF